MNVDDEKFEEMIEVGRVAYELSARHGRNAFAYAEQLQARAEMAGRPDEAEFWARVVASTKPRQ